MFVENACQNEDRHLKHLFCNQVNESLLKMNKPIRNGKLRMNNNSIIGFKNVSK